MAPGKGGCRLRPLCALATEQWQDEFTPLNDRHNLPPLPLPPISKPKTVVIVRHGQSSWNAESRVQGSSDDSVLTPKGIAQAEASAKMLEPQQFDAAYSSPLQRSALTADYVWGARTAPRFVDPVLREIDLYDFQGLLKTEVKARYPQERAAWQTAPNDFVLGGHYPVKELWYRASLAWQRILTQPADAQRLLIVAHNNTNQGLLCTALGLPTTYFRRLTQSNAAASVLNITPSQDPQGTPTAVLECLNRSTTANPFKGADKAMGRVTLLVPGNDASQDQVCAAFVALTKVDCVLTAPGSERLSSLVIAEQKQRHHSSPSQGSLGTSQEEQAAHARWAHLVQEASRGGQEGQHVVAIADQQATAELLSQAMDLEPQKAHIFMCLPGSCSVLDITSVSPRPSTAANCINLLAPEMQLLLSKNKK